MIALALEIFGMVSVATGICLLALAVYVKYSYQVVFEGFLARSGREGGALRFWTVLSLGILFVGAGGAMMVAARMGAI